MTLGPSIETNTVDTHTPFSSPLEDEDLGRRRIWEDGDEEHSLKISSKGKHKENGFADIDREGSEETELEAPDSSLYPPTTDEEAETKRIEENLRQWQINEMQKRKAARESISKPSQTTSDVGWRASSLWQKSSHRQRDLGKHTALGSQDSIEHLPLDNLVTTPGPSPSPSPLPSPLPPNLEEYPNDPFANPVSPFEDSQQVTAVMSSSEPPQNVPALTVIAPTPERPTLLAKSASFSRPPPPKPINLPPPKTPPPPVDVPPPAVSPLSLDGAPRQHQEPERETRWWHEWLCGCGEDRDADHQGGRTNPFE